MKKNVLLLILILFLLSSCLSITVKPLRYDGVYKRFRAEGQVDYIQVLDDKSFKIIYGFEGSDEEAIKALTNPEIKKILYSTLSDSIMFSSRSGSLVGTSKISLKDTIFLVLQNGKIIDKIDNRNIMKTNLYSVTGKKVLKVNFDEIIPFTDKLFITNNATLYGLKNFNSDSVLEEKYDYIGKPYEEYARVKLKNKWGFLNIDGKIVIEPEYDNVENFNLGIASVKKDGLWSLIDKEGKILFKKGFYKIGDYFTKRFIPVKLDRRAPWNFYNAETGNILKIDSPYYHPYKKLNLVVLGDNQKKLLVNTEGKPVLPYFFSDISVVDNNRFIVKAGNKYGIVDLQMKKISEFQYDRIYTISDYSKNNPFFSVKINKDEGVLDYNGNLIIEPGRGNVIQLSETVFKRYFYNKQFNTEAEIFNTTIKKPVFRAENFNRLFDNLFAYEIKKKWGVIDSNGKIIIKAKYNSIKHGAENQFIVQYEDKYQVVDINDKPFFDIDYRSIVYRYKKYFMTSHGSSYVYNKTLKEYKDFSIIKIYDDKLVGMGKNENSWGVGAIDIDGNVIVPFHYDSVSYDEKLKHFIVRKFQKTLNKRVRPYFKIF